MKIHVTLTSVLKDALGAERLELELGEGATVRQALERLKTDYPALNQELFDPDGHLEPHIFVAVNGAQASRDGSLDRPLKEGDEVALMVSFAGG
ncbi:MAG: ubiquitin-like small modifier protein 1 [Nitrospinota bacterium]